MPRRVLVNQGYERFDLVEQLAANELELQDVVKNNPQLLPSDDLGFDADLLVVGRETPLASGSIDLMCLARTGDLVLVEFKTGPQNPDFRHALAQLIDYGSDLWGMSLEDFDGVVRRYLRGPHCLPLFKNAANREEAIALTSWNLSAEEKESLHQRLGFVLANGDITFAVAAQRFTGQMTSSLDYLNATMRYGRFFLIEVVRLGGKDLTAYAAQVVARPATKTAAVTSAGRLNEADFIESLEPEKFRETVRTILAACSDLGLAVSWYSAGCSLRLRVSDRREPLSVGWIFREGGQWSGAKHLTLGVDTASLKMTPSVSSAVLAFVDQIADVTGGVPATGRGLSAYVFAPAHAPDAEQAILTALESLVAATSGTEGSANQTVDSSTGGMPF